LDTKGIITEEKYFAAANSCKGFVSYFDRVFDRNKFDRVFIIKGGPGTGKSSFMKKILSELSFPKVSAEAILCSSDPSSLDGIILASEKGRIAFIDGTAPHATDAKIPGAKDELIDLGKNWDSRFLIAEKEKICSLSVEKSVAYSTAYSYLSVAGKCEEISERIFEDNYDRTASQTFCKKLASELTDVGKGIKTQRLYSAFCKYGKITLDTLKNKAERIIKLSCDDAFAGFFLEDLASVLDYMSADYISVPTPLFPNRTEAVYLIDSKVLITGEGKNDEIDISQFTKKSTPLHKERTKTLESIRGFALEESKRWFGIASDLHFRLEDIYSQSMDFSKNDEIFGDKLTEVKSILEL